MRRFLDWLAGATCSWEIRVRVPDGKPVVVRGWWPIHSREETFAKADRICADYWNRRVDA